MEKYEKYKRGQRDFMMILTYVTNMMQVPNMDSK